MAIITKDNTRKRIIDLTGPNGNAFVLLGIAKGLCRDLGLNYHDINEELTSDDYENLITVFDNYFGDYIDLERQIQKKEKNKMEKIKVDIKVVDDAWYWVVINEKTGKMMGKGEEPSYDECIDTLNSYLNNLAVSMNF